MKSCFVSLLAAVGIMVMQPAAGQAPVPGNLWETTTQMEMPGMPMAMPARTQQACLAKNSNDPPVSSPPDSNCQMYDVMSAGGRTTWKMKCTGKQAMTGDGEITYQGTDRYDGRMNMTMDQGTMTMKMSGKRLGDCDAGATKREMVAAQKQSEQAHGQACASLVSTMQVQAFDGTYESGCGAKYKTDFCKRLSTEEGYDLLAVRTTPPGQSTSDLEKTGKACGVDSDDVRAKLCKSAETTNSDSLLFIARHCEAEAAPIAKAQCAGRVYSGVSSVAEQYREFCGVYGTQRLSKGSESAGAADGTAGAASGEAGASPGAQGEPGSAPPPKDSAIDAGKKALKKLFPF